MLRPVSSCSVLPQLFRPVPSCPREGVEAVVVEAVVGKDSLLRHVAEESGTESPLFHR